MEDVSGNQPVITGMGAVTPFGNGIETFWNSLKNGIHAFSPITLFPTQEQRTVIAAEVPELSDMNFFRLKEKTLSRADHFALRAVYEALENAHLLDTREKAIKFPKRTAIVIGTAAGGILGLEAFFRNRFHKRPIDFPQGLLSSFCLSAIATHIAQEFVIRGPRLTIATVCSSSGLALAAARELLQSKDLEQVVVVGTETLCEVTHAGFNSLRSVAPDKCQPFDLNRRGLILGEGAGAVVLEGSLSAAARGIAPVASLRGYGMRTDLHHFTAPQPEGNAVAGPISIALQDADMTSDDIDYLSAHGTGTPLNDVAETRGLKKIFGLRASDTPVSSIKSMIGHQLGAASIMQTIAVVMAMRHGIVPPTANLETPDPECDLDYVSQGARKMKVEAALSNAFAFGGSNISLVFSKVPGKKTSRNFDVPESGFIPVITGIGLTTPLGLGSKAFTDSLANGKSGITCLGSFGEEWAQTKGGLVDTALVKEKIPPAMRRRLNRQASFLFLSLKEAVEDAGIELAENRFDALTYGTAFGCSGNVHRFFSQILKDGPRFCSPQEFNMSVTNAPPSLVAREFGLDGPIWVFSGDEASWEISLHWGARLVRDGKAGRVIVNAAEELSDSILDIHQSLSWTGPDVKGAHLLGEGAVSMVLESAQSAVKRGARIYGHLNCFGTALDTSCGPLEYSRDQSVILEAASKGLEGIKERNGLLLYIVNRGDGQGQEERSDRLKEMWNGNYKEAEHFSLSGQSGLIGGLGLAAALLTEKNETTLNILVNTSARGGVEAFTQVERSENA
ncbi:beta-ketoacyl synthase N-terminal-like domain-containing protein [Thermodesulfobacteriota bacterium]